MTRALSEIERDVQELSPADRARLLQSLIKNLDAPSDADAESAWLAESERRLDQIESGEAQTYPGPDVLREARSRLK
jgi:putative addiction module component (TIGR02574 family)